MIDPGYASRTESLCPVCLRRLTAQRIVEDGEVFLCKRCPAHGDFRTPVWRGTPAFENWRRPKTPSKPPFSAMQTDQGCPFDCGLCPDHGQHTCTLLIEVTGRCNLACPVCFATAGEKPAPDPSPESLGRLMARQAATGGTCNLQLSGGEPTVRDDLPDIIRRARAAGFDFVQVNTNGLRLGTEAGYAERLAAAGLSSAFLQFDGADDAIFTTMRGRPLLAEKLAAIENLGRAGVGVVLVPTVKPGVNEHDLGNILRLAAGLSPTVRGVHFQPISYFGRYPKAPLDADRITLPEIMRLLDVQTGGQVGPAHCNPPGCEHALCSFSAKYLVMPDATLTPLSRAGAGGCGCASKSAPLGASPTTPPSAAEGARRSIDLTARNWSAPAPLEATPLAKKAPDDLDLFLERAQTHILTVSAMAFMDIWTLDLERLQGCCIHVAAPDGRRIPFCAYNATAMDGTTLYRGRLSEPD